MHEALRQRRSLLTVPSPAVAQMVRYDPLGLFDLLRDELGGSQAGVNLGVIDGGYIAANGQRRLLIAKPGAPPFDAGFSVALMTALEAARADIAAGRPAGDPANAAGDRPPLQVEFAGGHRIAVETASVIRRESVVNTVGSLALILPLLYLVFRSPWLVVVGSIPSAVSLVLVFGVLGATATTLSAAATASSAMLFGLGVDGVVLLYVAYAQAIRSGAEPAAAIDGLAGPASSMLLGMWTTAATFYGLTFVDFPSLEQLGSLIGHSMLACGVFTLVLVPALLPAARPARPPRALTLPRFAAWVCRRHRAVLVAALIATLAMAAAATQLRINPTLESLRAVTPGARLLQQIGPTFGIPDDVYVVLSSGADLEELLSANERLTAAIADALPAVAVQAPTRLLPSQVVQAHRQSMVQQRLVSAAAVNAALSSAEVAEGFRSGSFDPFRDRLPAMTEPRLRLSFDGYVSHGLADLIGRFVARRGDRWWLATYAFPRTAAEVATLERIVAGADPGSVLTGLPMVNRELAERFMPEFVRGVAIGSTVVVMLVLMAFRNWRLSLLSLAPTAVGLIWAAGGSQSSARTSICSRSSPSSPSSASVSTTASTWCTASRSTGTHRAPSPSSRRSFSSRP